MSVRLLWCIAACLLVLVPASAQAREEAPFYFLAVPVAQDGLVCMEAMQLDRQGKPVLARKKEAAFFTIWRSGYAAEKSPDTGAKNLEEWNKVLELRAQKAVASRPEMAGLPPSIVDFFVAVETLRAGALNQPPIMQPLFRAKGFVGWENAEHLQLLAVPDTVGGKERCRALLRTLGASQRDLEQDPGPWLKAFFQNMGVKVKSVRYWPEYNVFLFEGGADFKEMVDTLMNSTVLDRSRLPGAALCVMLAGS